MARLPRSRAPYAAQHVESDQHHSILGHVEATLIRLPIQADARRFHVTEKGVVLVTVDMLRSERSA